MKMKIILASTSIYRKQLLEKVGVEFQTEKPSFNEELAQEKAFSEKKTALQIAEILSQGKARSLLENKKDVLIISGDQLVLFEENILGKAHEFNRAFSQLKKMSGQTHQLITAVTLMTNQTIKHLNHVTTLKMKNLTDQEITDYLNKDQPYDCAGSYKIEKSGICLFEKIDCDDFTAIQGLPLIWLSTQLKELGYELFKK